MMHWVSKVSRFQRGCVGLNAQMGQGLLYRPAHDPLVNASTSRFLITAYLLLPSLGLINIPT